jgi:ribosomal protein S18 acetylase RimI-like enzyme
MVGQAPGCSTGPVPSASDEVTNAYVSTVVVAPEWQDRGVGRRVMDTLLEGRSALKITLDVRDGASSFYERLDFRRATNVFVRRPREGT